MSSEFGRTWAVRTSAIRMPRLDWRLLVPSAAPCPLDSPPLPSPCRAHPSKRPMIRSRDHRAERLQPLWWLGPPMLFCLVVGATMLAATWQSDAAYRLYGTPKFIAAKHLLLAAF